MFGIPMVIASPYRFGAYSGLIDFSDYEQERKKSRSYDSSGIALMMYIKQQILKKAYPFIWRKKTLIHGGIVNFWVTCTLYIQGAFQQRMLFRRNEHLDTEITLELPNLYRDSSRIGRKVEFWVSPKGLLK